jgi:hypothetical protein
MGAHLNYYDTALDPAGQLGRCVTLLLARYTGTRGQLGRCGARGRDRRANDPPPPPVGRGGLRSSKFFQIFDCGKL